MRIRSIVQAIAVLFLLACSAPPATPTAAPAKPTEAPKPAASPPASPSPAAAASPAAAPSPSPSPAAAAPVVTGEVDSVSGRVVTVSTNLGVRRVRVPESAQVQQEGKGSASDLVSGIWVGVTGRPDGTALMVRIFPRGIMPKPNQFPMTGAQAGNIMTNARIDSFDGRTLTVDLSGQKVELAVPAEAEIVKPVPASFSDIQAGRRIVAFGTPGPDILEAETVTILGRQ